jgi:hypothetical protein
LRPPSGEGAELVGVDRKETGLDGVGRRGAIARESVNVGKIGQLEPALVRLLEAEVCESANEVSERIGGIKRE